MSAEYTIPKLNICLLFILHFKYKHNIILSTVLHTYININGAYKNTKKKMVKGMTVCACVCPLAHVTKRTHTNMIENDEKERKRPSIFRDT